MEAETPANKESGSTELDEAAAGATKGEKRRRREESMSVHVQEEEATEVDSKGLEAVARGRGSNNGHGENWRSLYVTVNFILRLNQLIWNEVTNVVARRR